MANKMTETWQEKLTFEETNAEMLDASTLRDVTFLVGPNKVEIKAHKFMLSSRSQIFYAMFCGPLAEISSIEIPDIEPDAMNTLLRFIYTGDCALTMKSVTGVWYAAKKYCITRLEQQCETFLCSQICLNNVFSLYMWANVLDGKELKRRCFKRITARYQDLHVNRKYGFINLTKDILRTILESHYLVATEVDIYNSCKKWATHQLQELQSDRNRDISHADIRNMLGDLLYLIRFPTMSLNEFNNHCSYDQILTSDEKVSIFQYIISGSRNENFQFKTDKRNFVNQTTPSAMSTHVFTHAEIIEIAFCAIIVAIIACDVFFRK